MAEISWPAIIASLIGGGAAGAVITNIVSAYRARRQPVGYRIDVLPVFQATHRASDLKAVITIDDGGHEVKFRNLFLADIVVVNRGNKDLSKFLFGFTLAEGDAAVFVKRTPPDRFHQAYIPTCPSPAAPLQTVDVSLEPFNRGDSYHFQLYLVTFEGADSPGPIVMDSPEAVVFKPMPTLSELAEEAARGLSVRLGPFRLILFE